jgi:hypothetical protein
MSSPNQQEQNGSGKEKNKFLENLDALKNIFSKDPTILSPRKSVNPDIIEDIVSELYAEKNEEHRQAFKADLKALIEKYMQFEKEVAAKKKELEKLEADKMKEFNGVANQLFGRINDFKTWMADINAATLATTTAASTDNSGQEGEGSTNTPQA